MAGSAKNRMTQNGKQPPTARGHTTYLHVGTFICTHYMYTPHASSVTHHAPHARQRLAERRGGWGSNPFIRHLGQAVHAVPLLEVVATRLITAKAERGGSNPFDTSGKP